MNYYRNIASAFVSSIVVFAAQAAFADTEIVDGITWTYIVSNGEASLGSASDRAVPYDTKGSIAIPSVLGGRPVTSIGSSAFCGCSGLTSVTIPDSVTSIGFRAFSSCSGLTSVTIGNGVTSIGDEAFFNCSCLTSVTIPNSVTSIGVFAFYNCSGLTSVMIGDGLTSIGYSAFKGCDSLKSVTIPDGVTSIGVCAFESCSGLTSVTIGDGVPSIGDGAFYNCSGLMSVMIGNGVTSIGAEAFCGCSSLTSITIPNSVTSIECCAFKDCNAALYDTTTIPSVKLVDGWAVGYTGSLSGNLNLTGVRGIAGDAFYDCSGLTSVTIPDSVTSIGDSAFEYCDNLTSINIPNSVTNIGRMAFYRCSSLTSVKIPNSVAIIEELAFFDSGLENVTIPDSVKIIGDEAFRWCYLTSVTIPDSVTSIGEMAFQCNSSLTNVTIGNGVARIGYEAFAECKELICVTMRGDCPTCGSNVFDPRTNKKCILYLPAGNSTYPVNNGKWLGQTVAYYNPNSSLMVGDEDILLIAVTDGKSQTATVKEGTTAEDIRIIIGGVDVTAGFKVAVEGTTATVVLKEPFERTDDAAVSSKPPYQENDDGRTVTLNVNVVPGLYYAAASAATLEALKRPSAIEPAKAGDAVVVSKQDGSQGFYKVWVSDAPIMAE